VDIEGIIESAKKKGYFDPADYPGARLSMDELVEIQRGLMEGNIPVSVRKTIEGINKAEALEIINSLRKGVPPNIDVSCFSVGREQLIGKLKKDLEAVDQGHSRVRFINADYGAGKTHSLYYLREIAFRLGFVVSIVTLSPSSCPLHDFMQVYSKVMWGLRTSEERDDPALENVLDRWLEKIRSMGEDRARGIIEPLPDDLKAALHAYFESQSPLRPDERKRVSVLDYLSGKKMLKRDIRRMGIEQLINDGNALDLLGNMALLFRNLDYRGICIFFDEAEAVYSLASSRQMDKAFHNLSEICRVSGIISHCYFSYATTPGFFSSYGPYWGGPPIRRKDIFELDLLNTDELRELAGKVCDIYMIAVGKRISADMESELFNVAVKKDLQGTVGDFVRNVIGILDEQK